MAKGLNILTNFANKCEAWHDWQRIAARAIECGLPVDVIKKNKPPDDASWRKIDKCTAAIKAELETRGFDSEK